MGGGGRGGAGLMSSEGPRGQLPCAPVEMGSRGGWVFFLNSFIETQSHTIQSTHLKVYNSIILGVLHSF